MGRIDELKGISLLLQAFLELSPAEAELDIYGSGPDKDFVQHCMQLTAGYVHIKWKGRLKQSEVLSTMRLYDAIVLPSMFSEMSPLVIQEAFAIGIPVIGSNVYGIAELIKDGENGLLFEFGQKDSLVQKIRTLANDRSFLKKMTLNEKTVFNFQKVAAATWVEYCRLLEEPQYCSVKM